MWPDTLAEQQAMLAAYIRDPEHAPPPPGIEARRLKVYRELFLNNVQSLLAGNFPVLRSLHDDAAWEQRIRAFYREHDCHTPLFPELPREFLRWLETRAEAGGGDPPWMAELAHYEWVELALQISEARASDVPHDPDGDLLHGAPVVSPLAWPLAYAWPVHAIGPSYQPDAPPELPTLLLVRREPDGTVSFHALTPLAWRLLERLEAEPALSGREQLEALAAEAGAPDVDAFVHEGHALLRQFRADGTVLGTRPAGGG